VDILDAVVPALLERCLAEEQVSVLRGLFQAAA
jgi:hypothetical protein